jgi:hypothetical protein
VLRPPAARHRRPRPYRRAEPPESRAAATRRHAGPAVVVTGYVAGYVALALWVTWAWWMPLGARLTAINQPDATLFAWLLFTWTPHALGQNRPPLLATALNAPDGVNLMWNNGMPLPALLLAPVTAAWGGLATVTVLTAVGLAARPRPRLAPCALWALCPRRWAA